MANDPTPQLMPDEMIEAVEALLGPDPWVQPRIGITKLATSIIEGQDGRRLFAKWSPDGDGLLPLCREVAAHHTLGDKMPERSPRLLNVVMAKNSQLVGAIFEFVSGEERPRWTGKQIDEALDVLATLRTAPRIGNLSYGDMFKTWRQRGALDALSAPVLLVDDFGTFMDELLDAEDVAGHGDAYYRNWLIDDDERPVLVDFEHSAGVPLGWDEVWLLTSLELPVAEATSRIRAIVPQRRAAVLVAAAAGKLAYMLTRGDIEGSDRRHLNERFEDAILIWKALAG
jgi:hypothetical protein